MSDVKTINDPSRGPLSGIDDPVVRKEIGNLWTVIEGRLPATGKGTQPHTLVTNADLTRLESALSKRIDAIGAQAKPSAQFASSSSTTASASTLTPPLQIKMLEQGALLVAYPTIMLPENVTYAVDIQRTSSVSVDGIVIGGAAALLVQHRAMGTVPAGAVGLTSGIRCQVESRQQGTDGGTNAVVGIYTGLLNVGHECSGFGLHVDAYHRPTGSGSTTYGCNVEIYASNTSQMGKVVGYLLRSSGNSSFAQDYTRPTDYGFLASPDAAGTVARIEYGFSAGSDWVGPLYCTVAFDAAFARADLATFRGRADVPIILDGTAGDCTLIFNSSRSRVELGFPGSPEVPGNVKKVVSVRRNGDFVIEDGDLVINSPVGRGPSPALPDSPEADGLKHFGYFRIELGGMRRWVPFYGIYT